METILFVDGCVLREQIEAAGQPYTPQTIGQFLYRSVSEIKKLNGEADVKINYYGTRPVYGAKNPISKTPYVEQDMKEGLYRMTIPNAKEFNTFWGRSQKMEYATWIMKPESFEKDPKTLTDDDFVLKIQRKGVTTQLVDSMTETAVMGTTKKFFVLGNPQDLKYAADVVSDLGVDVDWVQFNGKMPQIEPSLTAQEPMLSSTDTLLHARQRLERTVPDYIPKLLKDLRSKSQQKRKILMLDMGCLTAYLHQNHLKVNPQNVCNLIAQISKQLGLGPEVEKICYATKKMHSKIKNPKKAFNLFIQSETPDSINGAIVSQGVLIQSKPYYTILKEKKWMTPHSERTAGDFEANIQQYDVDDRLACDMACARFDTGICEVIVGTGDSDFMHSFKKAKESGLMVRVLDICNDHSLSHQLADNAMGVQSLVIDAASLSKYGEKKENKNQHSQHRNGRKKGRKIYRTPTLSDEERRWFGDRKPTKKERWAEEHRMARGRKHEDSLDY